MTTEDMKMKHTGNVNTRSLSDNGSYTDACEEAVNNQLSFEKFKRDPRYTRILEHVSKDLGSQYLDVIKKQTPEFFNKFELFKKNDILGLPITVNYPSVGLISPSTLRYIKIASDIFTIFGDIKYDKICEIGAGYGGQMLINDQIINYSEYHLFDLPPVLELISKYLECHILNGSYKTYTLNRHNGEQEYDLVISNYAFSELPLELQKKYIFKILKNSKRGYLTMNSGLNSSVFKGNFLSVDQLKEFLPEIEVFKEEPETAKGNYVIVWNKL
jgi:hypothetical protein